MTVSLSLLPLASIVGAILAVLDAVYRIRRHGTGSQLAILELPLALLLFVAAYKPVHPYVSTSIAIEYLAIPLEVILIVLLLVRSKKRGASIWIAVAAVIVNGITAVAALLHIH